MPPRPTRSPGPSRTAPPMSSTSKALFGSRMMTKRSATLPMPRMKSLRTEVPKLGGGSIVSAPISMTSLTASASRPSSTRLPDRPSDLPPFFCDSAPRRRSRCSSSCPHGALAAEAGLQVDDRQHRAAQVDDAARTAQRVVNCQLGDGMMESKWRLSIGASIAGLSTTVPRNATRALVRRARYQCSGACPGTALPRCPSPPGRAPPARQCIKPPEQQHGLQLQPWRDAPIATAALGWRRPTRC